MPMIHQFTAVLEYDDEGDWWVSYSPEMPGAHGQGRSRNESLSSLRGAIRMLLEVQREEGLRSVPADAEREIITVEMPDAEVAA